MYKLIQMVLNMLDSGSELRWFKVKQSKTLVHTIN